MNDKRQHREEFGLLACSHFTLTSDAKHTGEKKRCIGSVFFESGWS
jgi:hypothetical protein